MRIFSYPRRAGTLVGCVLAAVLLVTVATQAGTWLDPNGGTITAPDMVVHTDGASDAKLHVACDSGCAASANQTVNQTQVNGVAVSVGNGTTDTGTQRVTLSSDGTGKVTIAAGTQAIGTIVPGVSASGNGNTTFTLVAANSNNSTSVKGSAGQVYHVSGFGISTTAPAFVKFYNKATAPTCGTDVPVWVEMIPAPAAGGAGFVDDIPSGLVFSTGIGICIVTGIANSDNTSVAATSYTINIGFK